MASQLGSQFDPLGIVSPYLLEGKLILQRVATSGAEWDEVVAADIQDCWKKWLKHSELLEEFFIPRNCLPDNCSKHAAAYQLHAFCDASNSAFCCEMYLRCLVEGKPIINFVLGKSKLVLTHQINWVISHKELGAAKLCCELTLLAKQALRDLDYTLHFWTDSQVILGWITNPELNLARFVKRRVDKILRVSLSATWKYIHTSQNPADVGTRGTAYKKPEFVKL